MKFTQVRMGDDFLYQGKRHTRTGPLTAYCEDDQREVFMKRSAVVSRADTAREDVSEARRADPDSSGSLQRFEDSLVQAIQQDADLEPALKQHLVELVRRTRESLRRIR